MLWRRTIPLTFVCILSFASYGCVTTGETPGTQDAAGDGGSERLGTAASFDSSSADAIVVMGIMANDVGPLTVQALWEPYDAASRKVVRGAPTRIWMRASAAPTPGERPDIAHAVFRVPPGEYVISRLMGNVERRFRVTDAVGDTLRIRPRAGEIVYVGDYVLTVTRLPLRVSAVTHNERLARAALAAYPDIRGEMKLTRPEPAVLGR